jgi:hypothetical protein
MKPNINNKSKSNTSITLLPMNRSKSPIIKKPEMDYKQKGTSRTKNEFNKSYEKTKTTVRKTNNNSLKFMDNYKHSLKNETKQVDVKSNTVKKTMEEPGVQVISEKKEKKHIEFILDDSPNTKPISNDNKRFSILDVPASVPKVELRGRNKAFFIIANSE